MSTRLDRSDALMRSRQCSSVVAIGFSRRTCLPASRKNLAAGWCRRWGRAISTPSTCVQDCLVVGGRAAAGELVRHGLSALRFDVHGDRDTYTILELIEALGVPRAHAAAADESQAEVWSSRFLWQRGNGWSRAIERGALRWGGRVRG